MKVERSGHQFKVFLIFFQPTEAEKPGILTNINYHGALLLQQLLNFGNPRVVVTSLIELKPVELKTLSCDRCGSHVMDAFFQSPSIGEKGREQMINRLKVCKVARMPKICYK